MIERKVPLPPVYWHAVAYPALVLNVGDRIARGTIVAVTRKRKCVSYKVRAGALKNRPYERAR